MATPMQPESPAATPRPDTVAPEAPQDSPTSLLKALALLSVTAVLVTGADLAATSASGGPPTLEERLPVRPAEAGVFFLGNSVPMTGIDQDLMIASLPQDVAVQFSFHDGHYTNLWYLILKNAILQLDEEPALLVWGFRPSYAVMPAFRQREVGDIELFLTDEEELYDKLVSPEGIQAADLPRQQNALEEWFTESSFFYVNREDIQEDLQRMMNLLSVNALGLLGTDSVERFRTGLVEGDLGVSDVLLQVLTHDEVEFAQELVVDEGDRFVTGPRVSFDQSFVPFITQLIEDAGIPQLVLVHKEVAYFEGGVSDEALALASQAVTYFEDEGISYMNLFEEPSIVADHFAKGDHYNPEGRTHLTELIAARIRAELAG